MALSPGARLGSHEIVCLLGAGGMGEVYRAVDTRLNRHVAIKVLPDLYAADTERIKRLHREAQAVAALNHTRIAAIYELAEAESTTYLVLELIEGETLADRLQRGPVPVEEALQIARQILEALETAHEKGICHRDLKPANVKLTPDGSVKVLDFGLAKFLQTATATASLTNSPTLSLAGTLPGVILGTAAYMSPEQAKGYEADQRSDIFSFGCILFELLTGRRAFDGESVSDVLASVLKSEADFTQLPSRLNPRLVELLGRCLEKSPKKRWHAAADVRVEIESIIGRGLITPERPAAASVRPLWKRAITVAAAALAGAGIAGYGVWTLKPEPSGTVARFLVQLPEGVTFSNTSRRVVDVSPDGTKLVYVGGSRLYLREVGSLESRVVAGTESATAPGNPVFSPDGQSIAYAVAASGGGQIKKVSVTGGAAVTVCDIGSVLGMSWGEQGIVIGQGPKGIVRVSPNGGQPEVLLAAGPDEHLGSPQLLAGGTVLLYTTKKASENWERGQIAAQRLAGGERKALINGGTDGRYLATGHLVYMLSGVLLAVPFDVQQLEVIGGPVPVVEGVRRASMNAASSGSSQMAVSGNGTLVYVPGQVSSDAGNDLAFFDRDGKTEQLKLPLDVYGAPRVSPDGKLLAFETTNEKDSAVWVYELSGATAMRRLTFGGKNRAPMWSPDGQWIAFQSDREGDLAIFRQRADGSGAAERLTTPERGSEHIPQHWSPDGARLLFTIRRDQQFTLATMSLTDRKIAPVADTQSPVMINAMFAPDGRWIAYQGREGSGNVVYVQPFPSTGAKYLLPQEGAGHPTWLPKGNEIVVNYAPQRSAIVTVTARPGFAFGRPSEFPRGGRFEPNPATERRNIDFMPDGRRLIGVLLPGQSGGVVSNQFVVVLNWFEELRQRVTTPD